MSMNQSTAFYFSLLIGVVSWGCNGSSPTSPGAGGSAPASGMTISYSDASGQLDGRREEISGHIETAWRRVSVDLPVDGLAVEVIPGPRLIIPAWGVGGRAPNGFEIEIAVEPTLPEGSVGERLPSIVAHELHHVGRHRGPGYGGTLLQAMVSEGLADHYSIEVYGHPAPPWATALSDPEIDTWIVNAKPEFDSTSYNHSAWFFGTGNSIPRWVGYTVGFRLVSDYLEAHPGATAASLVNLGADAFRPD